MFGLVFLTTLWEVIRKRFGVYLILFGIGIAASIGSYWKGRLDEHTRNLAKEATSAREGETKIIHDTQVITKVIRDAHDPCSDTALPAAVRNSLR